MRHLLILFCIVLCTGVSLTHAQTAACAFDFREVDRQLSRARAASVSDNVETALDAVNEAQLALAALSEECGGEALAPIANRAADCDGAQRWYDDIDRDDMLADGVRAMTGVIRTPSAQFAAIESVRDIADRLESDDYPSCIADIREGYIAGLRLYADAATFRLDGNDLMYFANLIPAIQSISEFRGYIAALGVELHEDDTLPFLLR